MDGVVVIIYMLAFAQAVSAGLVFAFASASRHRFVLNVSGFLLVGVAVGAGFALGSRAPWIGPIFAVAASVTGLVATAWSLGDDPVMRGEPFGQRIVYALSRRAHRTDSDASMS